MSSHTPGFEKILFQAKLPHFFDLSAVSKLQENKQPILISSVDGSKEIRYVVLGEHTIRLYNGVVVLRAVGYYRGNGIRKWCRFKISINWQTELVMVSIPIRKSMLHYEQ